MANPKYTTSAQEALQEAQHAAIRRDHQAMQPEHLLAALIAGESGEDATAFVSNVLQTAGVNLAALKKRVAEALTKLPRVSGGSGQLFGSGLLNRVIVLAEEEAKALGDEFISGEH